MQQRYISSGISFSYFNPTGWSLYCYLEICDDHVFQQPNSRETGYSNVLGFSTPKVYLGPMKMKTELQKISSMKMKTELLKISSHGLENEK